MLMTDYKMSLKDSVLYKGSRALLREEDGIDPGQGHI